MPGGVAEKLCWRSRSVGHMALDTPLACFEYKTHSIVRVWVPPSYTLGLKAFQENKTMRVLPEWVMRELCLRWANDGRLPLRNAEGASAGDREEAGGVVVNGVLRFEEVADEKAVGDGVVVVGVVGGEECFDEPEVLDVVSPFGVEGRVADGWGDGLVFSGFCICLMVVLTGLLLASSQPQKCIFCVPSTRK